MPLLSCKNLFKSFNERKDILKGIDLIIDSGNSIAIVGRSGEGKSTFLSILSGLLEASSGEVFFEDKPLVGSDAKTRREMGFIFQSSFLLEDESVLDNILMPSYLKGEKVSQEKIDQIKEELHRLGFHQSLDAKAAILSGGEKQKVATLRALCDEPKVVFADEPTGNLDVTSSVELQNYILSKVEKSKAAFVLVTHDEKFAHRCKTVYCLEGGKLHQKQ